MNNIAIIILGRESDDHRLDFLTSLTNIDKIIDVPFVDSSMNLNWTKWQDDNGNFPVGIGPGAAGCYLAHLAAWEIITSENLSAALILEDDALITKYGERYLGQVILDFSKNDFNVVHLGNDYKVGIRNPITLAMRHGIRHMLKAIYELVFLRFRPPAYFRNDFPFSTHAYLINKSMAKALSSETPSFLLPVDVFLNGISQVKRNKVFRIRSQVFVQMHTNRTSLVTNGGR